MHLKISLAKYQPFCLHSSCSPIAQRSKWCAWGHCGYFHPRVPETNGWDRNNIFFYYISLLAAFRKTPTSHHKNIERHTAHTIVSWPNPKQWVIIHTSDLMMIIRQSVYSLNHLSIYLRVYSLHHNVLPTLQSIPLMNNEPLYPITQDSSCHGQHTMSRSPWSFPWPVPHSCVCMNVCVLQWRKLCVVVL